MGSAHYRREKVEELRKDQLSSSWSGHDARLVKPETMGNDGGRAGTDFRKILGIEGQLNLCGRFDDFTGLDPWTMLVWGRWMRSLEIEWLVNTNSPPDEDEDGREMRAMAHGCAAGGKGITTITCADESRDSTCTSCLSA